MNTLVHWDIPSTDLAKSKAFYQKLFGWKMEQWSEQYVLFSGPGGFGGGISKAKKVAKPCLDVYIEVASIPASLKKAVALGGKVAQPKTAIGGNMGYMAFLFDPCGCRIGLWSKK